MDIYLWNIGFDVVNSFSVKARIKTSHDDTEGEAKKRSKLEILRFNVKDLGMVWIEGDGWHQVTWRESKCRFNLTEEVCVREL